MQTRAVVLHHPGRLGLDHVELVEPRDGDAVVEVAWSGISTGTERLLYAGTMPAFPGLGYPLVPGYESVGRVVETCGAGAVKVGDHVFVPGSRGFAEVRGLFGGAAARLVVPAARLVPVEAEWGEDAVLLALAATAFHATAAPAAVLPDLVVGHGALGRLLARVAVAKGGPPPTVWDSNPLRRGGETGCRVIDPAEDERRDYQAIYDVSGDAGLLDTLVQHLAPGGEIVLAGFYSAPLSLSFPPAFMREARIRVAAEWRPADMAATIDLVRAGRLRLDGLVTHRNAAAAAAEAYRTAFADPACLKMLLDWRAPS